MAIARGKPSFDLYSKGRFRGYLKTQQLRVEADRLLTEGQTDFEEKVC